MGKRKRIKTIKTTLVGSTDVRKAKQLTRAHYAGVSPEAKTRKDCMNLANGVSDLNRLGNNFL